MTDDDAKPNDIGEPFQALSPHMGKTPIAPAHGVAAIALTMALKYHDINTVQDGALYQQYKLEGRNMDTLHLDDVFATAIRMEAHLMGSSERIAALLIEAVIAPDPSDDGQPENEAALNDGQRSAEESAT